MMEELKSILCMIMEFFHIGEGVFVMEALFPHKVSISNLGQVNSGSIKAQAILDDAVLYPNPYMVISQTSYTKHYYALFWCVISELIISFLCNIIYSKIAIWC